MNLEKVIELLRSMHVNNPNENMCRREFAQIITIILYNLIDNEKITQAIETVDSKNKALHDS